MYIQTLKIAGATLLLAIGAAAVGDTPRASEPVAAEPAQAAQAATRITVYKSPNCSCCMDWAEHLEQNGFSVRMESVDNLREIKSEYGVPREMMSCHTAVVEGLVVEGHVPAADIKAYLANPTSHFKDATVGLSVPGMPHGTPGMETGRQDSYSVLAFTADGRAEIVKRYSHD